MRRVINIDLQVPAGTTVAFRWDDLPAAVRADGLSWFYLVRIGVACHPGLAAGAPIYVSLTRDPITAGYNGGWPVSTWGDGGPLVLELGATVFEPIWFFNPYMDDVTAELQIVAEDGRIAPAASRDKQ